MGDFLNLIGPHDGARFPGGCESCNAYQTLKLVDRLEVRITTHHDKTCPAWRDSLSPKGI